MEENLISLRTAIYVRVSTEEQAREGYSINAQIEKLKQYAVARSWIIGDIYVDEGKSGKDLKGRPEVLRMLADVKTKIINNVLIYKIDRLTRSTKNLIELIELFNDYNCAFNSLMEAIDTSSATGRMFLKIVGIFAEFERENLAERVSLGIEQKAREGNYINTNGVNGYDYIVGSGELVVNEEEAEMVREIYDLYLSGNSMQKISKHLIAKQMPTKRGGIWSSAVVHTILTNPLYIGKIRYGGSNKKKSFTVDTDKHDPIIDTDTFTRVQEIIKKRKKFETRKYPSENSYFLSFLRCSECNHLLGSISHRNAEVDKVYANYYCPNYKIDKCKSRGFSHIKIEKAFEAYLENFDSFDFDDTVIKAEDHKQEDTKLNNLKNQINKTQAKIKEFQFLFMQDKISFEEYRECTSVLNEKLRYLQDEYIPLIKTDENNHEELDIESIRDIIGNLKLNWVNLNNKEKIQFLTMFVSYIKAYSDNGVVKITDIQFVKTSNLKHK